MLGPRNILQPATESFSEKIMYTNEYVKYTSD